MSSSRAHGCRGSHAEVYLAPVRSLTDLRPGDEPVIIVAGPDATTGTEAASPSAMSRESASPAPTNASEIMVFRPLPDWYEKPGEA
jgi:hypothetical protein